MQKTYTTQQALMKGQKMISLPSMISMFGLMGMFFFMSRAGWIPSQGMLIGIMIGILVSWLVWSIQVPKWKVWVFQNCANAEEVISKAADSKLIWRKGHIFARTEIWTSEQKKQLRESSES